MGAWGHGPFDNDSAEELRDSVFKSNNPMKEIEAALNNGEEYERRAAAVIINWLSKIDGRKIRGLKRVAADELKKILADKEWIDGWDSPAAARAMMVRELKDLRK